MKRIHKATDHETGVLKSAALSNKSHLSLTVLCQALLVSSIPNPSFNRTQFPSQIHSTTPSK